jgi:ATP-binding protein involved in chromosome partitioning
MVHGLIRQFALDVAWDDLDYLIADLPPGTGDVQISMCRMIPPTGAVIISTPQDVALQDAVRAVKMFQAAGTPMLGLIENMSHLHCPKCDEKIDLFGEGGVRRASERLSMPFLGSVPLDLEVRAGGDSGMPIVVRRPDSLAAKTFVEVARALAARVSVENSREKP